MRNLPAAMDAMEKLPLSGCGLADPLFEVVITLLPVAPIERRLTDGTLGGIEIINIERAGGEADFARGVLEVLKDEFGVLGEVESGVELEIVFADNVGFENFVGNWVEAAVLK